MKGRVVVKIQESAENYLETIHMLSKHKPYVRSIDIANELSFSKPSVSVAMKNLRENGYIHMDDQGHITLTQTGQDIADKMYERHIMLSNWLIYLGVDEKTAVEDACKIDSSSIKPLHSKRGTSSISTVGILHSCRPPTATPAIT